MSLIEDARRISEAEAPLMGDAWCWFCPARLVGYEHFVEATPHESNCPWLSLPRIVRALEAAGQMVSIYRDLKKYEGRMDHFVSEWEALENLSEAKNDAP